MYLFFDLYAYLDESKEKRRLNKGRAAVYITIWIVAILVYLLGWISVKALSLGILMGAFLSILILAVMLIAKVVFWIQGRSRIRIRIISMVNKKGFLVYNGKTSKKYQWSDFDSVKLSSNPFELEFRGQKNLKINEKYSGFYTLLKNIPSFYRGLDFGQINDFFKKLQPCPVCGLFAVTDKKCLYCQTENYDETLHKEYSSKQDYIIKNQLSVFSTWEEEEEFCNFKFDDHAFETDQAWKPAVTKEEVLEYSKKENW